jgi:hypothetical protein
MKVEHNCYIVVTEEDNKTLYLTRDDILTEEIYHAVKAVNKIAAKDLINSYIETQQWRYLREEINNEEYMRSCNFDFKVVPLKITYEWL